MPYRHLIVPAALLAFLTPPYVGSMSVVWRDIDVAAEATSWSSVKGLFR